MASLVKTDKISTTAGGAQEFTLPAADGTANQHLKTDGSGILGWASPPSANPLTLTGSTNTWIPTITGADALTGTANFTYDGNTLDVKNGGTASSIKLYCESSNAHYQAIKAAPHSGSSDWTLTLPPTVPSVSGQLLSATTAGVSSWVDAPAGGLSHASIWRLNTSFIVTAGVESLISANLEEDDSTGAARIGAAMTVSTGIWTFPSTGIWRITSTGSWYWGSGSNTYCYIRNYSTVDNSTWVFRGYVSDGISASVPQQASGTSSFLLDVTDTSLCKVKFFGFSPSAVGLSGETDKNRTTFEFYKLGDT